MKQKLSDLLDEASAIELQVADIYEHLSNQFKAEEPLSHFWALFAEAERYHSLLIQMQKLGMTDPTGDSAQVDEWAGEIAETRRYLADILTRLKEGGWSPNIDEAFEMAHGIECKSLEIQSRSFTLFDSPAIKELVAALHEEDMKHRAKLLEARERFGSGAVH